MPNKAKILSEALSWDKRAQDAASRNDWMSASVDSARALQLYKRVQDSQNIQKLKAKMIEYSVKAETQLQDHEITLPDGEKLEEELNLHIDELTKSDTLLENISNIAKSQNVTPDYDESIKTAESVVPVTAQIATHITYGENGHVKSFDNFNKTWQSQNYQFGMDLAVGIVAVSYQRLITKNQLTRDALVQILVDRNVFSFDILAKFDAAVERGVDNDYFSATHILVPLIESCFMHVSKLVGLDTVTLNGDDISTRTKTLDSRLLARKDYQKLWGKNFCMMLDFYLYSEQGFSYRNKLAHGEIKIHQTHFSLYVMLVHIIMRMSLMVKVVQNETEK